MYTATSLEMGHPVFTFGEAIAALKSKLWDLAKYLFHGARLHQSVLEVSVTEISDSESEPEDPNEELASQLKGRTLTWTADMLSMFQDLGWTALDMDRKKWSAEHEETYLRLKLDLEDVLDRYVGDLISRQRSLSPAC
jgi:hypothetical protein